MILFPMDIPGLGEDPDLQNALALSLRESSVGISQDASAERKKSADLEEDHSHGPGDSKVNAEQTRMIFDKNQPPTVSEKMLIKMFTNKKVPEVVIINKILPYLRKNQVKTINPPGMGMDAFFAFVHIQDDFFLTSTCFGKLILYNARTLKSEVLCDFGRIKQVSEYVELKYMGHDKVVICLRCNELNKESKRFFVFNLKDKNVEDFSKEFDKCYCINDKEYVFCRCAADETEIMHYDCQNDRIYSYFVEGHIRFNKVFFNHHERSVIFHNSLSSFKIILGEYFVEPFRFNCTCKEGLSYNYSFITEKCPACSSLKKRGFLKIDMLNCDRRLESQSDCSTNDSSKEPLLKNNYFLINNLQIDIRDFLKTYGIIPLEEKFFKCLLCNGKVIVYYEGNIFIIRYKRHYDIQAETDEHTSSVLNSGCIIQ